MIANLLALLAASSSLNAANVELLQNVDDIQKNCLFVSETIGLEGTLEKQNLVRDLNGNVFIVQLSNDVGYLIFDPVSQAPVEISLSSPCPYDFDLEINNYYFGPMNSFYLFQNEFISCFDENTRINLTTALEMQVEFETKLSEIRKNVSSQNNSQPPSIEKKSQRYGFDVFIDNYELITRETHPTNYDGTCGYVAASIVLNYWNKTMHKGTVPERFYDENGQLNTDGNNNKNLLQELLRCGNNVKESYPWSISDALNAYCNDYNIDGFADWFILDFDVKTQIDLGHPVIIFGALQDVSKNDVSLIAHAVVCYGYKNILGNVYYYVNYGWENEYNEMLIHPGILVGGTTSFKLNSCVYEKEYTIAPNEYGFSSSYCTYKDTKTITKDDFSFETTRYRCGFIENEYVNLSARKQGYNCAYLEYKFKNPLNWVNINISFWSDDERFKGLNKAFAAIQYKSLYSNDWITAIDLLNDVDLSTDRKNQNQFLISFPEKAKEFRVVAHFYEVSGLNDRNKGRISIGNITFSTYC